MKKPERQPKKKRSAGTRAEQTKKAPAATEPTREGSPSGRDGKPSEEEVITNWSQPVTNRDEQEKITNAGKGDIPIPEK